jgi:NAD(P)-dependent dehydrogenase (short-subunit alcohol dehydrogenase family)
MGEREFEGRVAFVTGAGHGMARATALKFARQGAGLGLVDANADELDAVATECRSLGAHVVERVVDLASPTSVHDAVAAVHEGLGRIDAAANIAGIYPRALVEEASDEHWDAVIGHNLTGTFACCRALVPIMKAQGGGAIVNVSSPAGFRAVAGMAAYSASKAGIVALSRTLAVEAAPVRVNVVSPGATATGDTDAPSLAVPLGRMAYPDEVAEAIRWLCSSGSSYLTGQVLHVDGGGSVL